MIRYEESRELWSALGIKEEDNFIGLCKMAMQNCVYLNHYDYILENSFKGFIFKMPKPLRSYFLIESVKDIKNDFLKLSPIFEGIKNKIKITDKHLYENKYEGDISFELKGMEFSFYAPFYQHDFSASKIGSELEVNLVGYASFIESAPLEFDVTQGGLFDLALADFLKENPTKQKEDFQGLKVSSAGVVSTFPSDYYNDMHIVVLSLNLKSSSLFVKKYIVQKSH